MNRIEFPFDDGELWIDGKQYEIISIYKKGPKLMITYDELDPITPPNTIFVKPFDEFTITNENQLTNSRESKP